MIVYQLHDAVYTSVYGTAVIIFITKVLFSGTFLIFCHMHRMTYKLVYAFVFRSRNRNDGDAEQSLHIIDTYRSAVTPHLIHHVDGQNHRHIQLYKLHGQIQVTLDIGSVHYVNDALRLLIQYVLA